MISIDYRKELDDLIDIVITESGSDIHLSVGSHPIIRVDGSIIPLLKKPVLTRDDLESFVKILLTKDQEVRFLGSREVDFSFAAKDGIRFRGNGFYQRGSISIALRYITNVIKSFEELALPPILESFTERPQGFFLCVGPVGQGKSTTLATMIERINLNRAEHIMTIEDPIEFIFEPKKSLIDQREVRVDTADFHSGLHSAFRQDVDVIMVGEMRGKDTISTAVTAAETGHLV